MEPSRGFTTVSKSILHGAVGFFEEAASSHSMSMKMDFSPFDVGTGSVDDKRQAASLPLTGWPVIADVNMEDTVAENENGIGVDLSSTARPAYGQLPNVMRSVCMVHDVPFQSLLKAVKQSGEHFSNVLHAVNCYLLNNTCHIT